MNLPNRFTVIATLVILGGCVDPLTPTPDSTFDVARNDSLDVVAKVVAGEAQFAVSDGERIYARNFIGLSTDSALADDDCGYYYDGLYYNWIQRAGPEPLEHGCDELSDGFLGTTSRTYGFYASDSKLLLARFVIGAPYPDVFASLGGWEIQWVGANAKAVVFDYFPHQVVVVHSAYFNASNAYYLTYLQGSSSCTEFYFPSSSWDVIEALGGEEPNNTAQARIAGVITDNYGTFCVMTPIDYQFD